jgi:hypothetical protein
MVERQGSFTETDERVTLKIGARAIDEAKLLKERLGKRLGVRQRPSPV